MQPTSAYDFLPVITAPIIFTLSLKEYTSRLLLGLVELPLSLTLRFGAILNKNLYLIIQRSNTVSVKHVL
jgi:hypothetical protein